MDSALLLIIIFAGLILLTIVIFLSVRSLLKRRKLVGKIKQERSFSFSEEVGKTHLVTDTTINKPDQEPLKQIFMKIAGKFGNVAKPKREEDISYIRRLLVNIGYRNKNAVSIFLGVKVLCTIMLPVSFSLLKLVIHKPMSSFTLMFIFILLALLGFYLPNIWLRTKIANRKEKIMRGFPDALDLMVVCVEGGMGLDAAINRVGEEMKLGNKEISEEFKILNIEMRLGKLRRDALKNLARRVGLEDMNNLVTLLNQSEKFGTSVANALRVYSDSMRNKRYQRAEEKAAKLPVKLLIPLILCIFPSLFIVILGPALIQAFRIFK